MNLLTNAAKYTKNGGRVTVRATTDANEAVIEVIDTGIGLPPELLNRVFDLFAQADRTLDRSEGGLGIGLTVAQKLAEMHGGMITADSEGLGKGSTFTVRLPISQQTPTGGKESPRGPNRRRRSRRKRFWSSTIIATRRCPVHGCLKGMGHEVQTAFDGLAALEVARSFKPQAILLDIGLPGMNGFEVARTLRDEGSQNELIVAVSGYGQPEDRERSRQAGFDDHLVKPVHQDALAIVLQAERRAACGSLLSSRASLGTMLCHAERRGRRECILRSLCASA